ncbi:MAG TPA: hypothetical protein VMR76_00130 [Candidatus Saccharimonadia bacterium]|nr:hypothetical protein [Candidatus Saccharimonadia bacterium]
MPEMARKRRSKSAKPKVTKKNTLKKEIPQKQLSSVASLLKKSYLLIKFQKKFLVLSFLLYLVLSISLVANIGALDSVIHLKKIHGGSLGGFGTNLSSSFSTLGSISTSSNNSGSSLGSLFQILFLITFSLIFIRAIRKAYAQKTINFLDGIYSATANLIQMILVVLLLLLELLPIVFSIAIYAVILNNGIASNDFERVIWAILCLGIALLGVYLLISTIFALYIVTLPDMRPIKAIKSSWEVVRKRRILIFLKILGLVLSLVIAIGLITFLLVLIIPITASWVLFILGLFAVIIFHSYMYSLYRELI